MRMTKKEKLTIKIFETRQELGRQAAAEVAGAINELLKTRPEISKMCIRDRAPSECRLPGAAWRCSAAAAADIEPGRRIPLP